MMELRLSERVAKLETKEENLSETVKGHQILITALDKKMDKVISKIGNISIALYVMALAILANVPAAVEIVKAVLNFKF